MDRRFTGAGLVVLFLITSGCSGGPTRPEAVTAVGGSPGSSLSAAAPIAPRNTGKAQNSEQVVFSGVAGSGSTFPNGSPAGFWIWCEADSRNPYQGECNGSMYFYALGITKHVEGELVETSEGVYQMTVSSTLDTSIVGCVLTNDVPVVNGPHNTVHVSCATPSGSASTSGAVVNVTGPPE
jgi:hypothetical protein